MNCPNCNTPLTCGCQKRTAGNGKQCCSSCIGKCNQSAGIPGMPQQTPTRPSITPRGPFTPHP